MNEVEKVDAIGALAARLPGQAAQIRKRFWRDPEFRSICNDHHDAADMLTLLEHSVPPDPRRLAEYRSLVAELLSEAIDMLERESHDEFGS